MKTVTVEYIWLGGHGEIRSKTRVLNNINNRQVELKDIPEWNYDGSSTCQATGEASEIILKPCYIFKNPLLYNTYNIKTIVEGYLVVCDTYDSNDNACETNNREWANTLFNMKLKEEPWFGLEQEYFVIKNDNIHEFQDSVTNMKSQGAYYCGNDYINGNYGKIISEHHLYACIHAGIKISGKNEEVAPCQWEYQIGPCLGIETGDHMIASRYLLQVIAENNKCSICWEPKPLKGDWNGSGCHTNYSTKNMRDGTKHKKGVNYIYDAIDKLKNKHDYHMQHYGKDNEQRMTGEHETSSYKKFTFDVANRGCSVRVGNETVKNEKGYFEDRRPSSNCDPYLVTGLIFKTTCL